jgi:hypothetical protein
MRRALALSLLLLAAPAFAQSAAERQYLAVRDAAIAEAKAAGQRGVPVADIDKRNNEILAELQKQLRAIVGHVPGTQGEGKLHLDTLSEGELGTGALDALDFDVSEGRTVTVTTVALLRRWLKDHETWWGKGERRMPQTMAAALKMDAFYTQALSTGAAAVVYAELPLRKPKGAEIAIALLAGSTQDQAPAAANDIYVAAVARGKLYLTQTKAPQKVGPISACDATRKTRDAAIEQAAADRRSALEKASEAAFLRCFARGASAAPGFAEAAREAQSLLARLPLPAL